jgi:hypothetical protein
MAGSATVANTPEILKELWEGEVEEYMLSGMALYAMLPKSTDWDGEILNMTYMIGGMGGRSATFEDALQYKSPSKYKKAQLETADNFAVWSIDHKLITLSRNNRGALVRALDASTRHAFDKFKRAVAWQLHGNGGGCWGEIGSISTNTIVLADAEDATRVDIDDVVAISSDDGVAGAGILPHTQYLTVTGVDEKTGTITFDVNVTTAFPGASTTNKHLFFAGDYGAVITGLDAICPYGTPANYFGMVRTTHRTKLAGVPVGGSGLQVHEGISKALSVSKRLRVSPTHLFMSPGLFNELDLTLGTQRRYADVKVGTVGFTGIEFANGEGAPVKCFPDIDMKGRKVRGLDMDGLEFKSADDYPLWLTVGDQKEFFSEANANAFQGRIGGYGQLVPQHFKHFILDLDQADA